MRCRALLLGLSLVAACSERPHAERMRSPEPSRPDDIADAAASPPSHCGEPPSRWREVVSEADGLWLAAPDGARCDLIETPTALDWFWIDQRAGALWFLTRGARGANLHVLDLLDPVATPSIVAVDAPWTPIEIEYDAAAAENTEPQIVRALVAPSGLVSFSRGGHGCDRLGCPVQSASVVPLLARLHARQARGIRHVAWRNETPPLVRSEPVRQGLFASLSRYHRDSARACYEHAADPQRVAISVELDAWCRVVSTSVVFRERAEDTKLDACLMASLADWRPCTHEQPWLSTRTSIAFRPTASSTAP